MAISVQCLTLAIFLTWLQLVATQPRANEASLDGPRGLKVFVNKKGGTIRLYRELLPGPPPKPSDGREQNGGQKPKPNKEDGDEKEKNKRPPPRSGQIAVSFGRIQEVDSSSNAISGNHGVQKPDNVDFTVTTEKDRALQRAAAGVGEIRGDCLDCRSSLKDAGDAGMTLTVCVVKTNGTLMLDNEQTPVYTGQLKFSVRLDRWPWATSGQYVDVDVIMKVPSGRAMRKKASKGRGHPVGFELGADAAAFFPNKLLADGTWRDMQDGYPKFDNKGANNIVTLRVPRFSNYAFYDPTIETGYESGSCGIQAPFLVVCSALIGFIAFAY